MTTSIFITVWMQTILRLKITSTIQISVFKKALLQATIPDWGTHLRILQAIFIAKTSKYTDSWDKAGLVAMPWPLRNRLSPLFPGIRNKPSWAAAVPAWPHSFAGIICPFLAWVLTSLILGVQDLASGPLHSKILHATWSLLSSGTRTRCCCSPTLFPWDMFRKV